jgi:hypothetical protein
MGLRKLMLVLCVLSINACAPRHRPVVDEQDARSFAAIYRKAKESGLVSSRSEGKARLGPDIGYEKPFFPVYVPPKVAKMWVPAHVGQGDRAVMVAGHWSYLIVEEPHWYIEEK